MTYSVRTPVILTLPNTVGFFSGFVTERKWDQVGIFNCPGDPLRRNLSSRLPGAVSLSRDTGRRWRGELWRGPHPYRRANHNPIERRPGDKPPPQRKTRPGHLPTRKKGTTGGEVRDEPPEDHTGAGHTQRETQDGHQNGIPSNAVRQDGVPSWCLSYGPVGDAAA